MANKLSDEIAVIVQRAGTNAGRLRTESERAAFSSSVRGDLANIIYQYNTVVYPLFNALSSETGINALDLGLCGNTMFTHISANEADATAYYDSSLSRAHTVKETIDVLLGELSRLENLIATTSATTTYDDTAVRSLITANQLDLQQIIKDAFGLTYTLDGDGVEDLPYSLSQAIDEMGAFFSGFPGTGNTYTRTYPTLSLTVLLSSIVIDTTLPQSTITDLTDDLGYIRDFIGMSTTGPESPVYSDHGAISYVADGDTLEEAIQKLDAAVGNSEFFGNTVVTAKELIVNPLATGPNINVETYGDMVIQTLDFFGGGTETAYAAVPIPSAEISTTRPSKVKVTGHFVAKPNTFSGGVYNSGDGFAFALYMSDSGSASTVGSGLTIDAGWQASVTKSDTSLDSTSMNKHYVLEWPAVTLAANSLGLLNLKIERDVADADDTWQDDIGLLCLHVTWYA